MSGLSRRLGRLEALRTHTPRVWLEDPDATGTVVCTRTGERLSAEAAGRLDSGHIVVVYVSDGRDI